MNCRLLTSFAGTGVALSLVVGCTLGPDPERPTTTADVAGAFVHASGADLTPLPEVTPWWQEFGDETTTELVDLALANNPDLHAAAARVLEAEAGFRRAGGARWPQAGYGVGATRQKMSFVLPGTGRREIFSTTYSYDLNVSWQADLFGRLKRTRQASWASLLAEEASREAVIHSVVGAVVRARVLVATAGWALEINRDITESWQSTLRTVERRYKAGIADAVEVHLARENLASARASEAMIAAQLEQAKLAIDVLVGRRPGSGGDLPDTLPRLPSLDPVPVGLPAQLLDRRPDLRQAEMQLAAATYGVGAAIATLYPDLSLTGSAGGRSDALADLTSVDGIVYNAIANLVGPIFSGGQRRADVDAARARAEQATAMYAGAVLNALRDVEEALVLSDASQRNREFSDERVEEARAADRLAKERYQRGVASLLTVLETERRLRLAEQANLAATADVWNSRVDLFLSLGGDWSTDISDAQTESVETQARNENSKSEIRNSKSEEVL